MSRKQHTLIVVPALIAGLVGGVISSQFFMRQPVLVEKIIRAEKFELVNKNGEVMTELEHDEGTTLLTINSKQGDPNLFIFCRNDSTVLTLGNSDTGTIGLTLVGGLAECTISAGGKESISDISLGSYKGLCNLVLRGGGYHNELRASNTTGLLLTDRNEKGRAILMLKDDRPSLLLADKNEKTRVGLALDDDQRPFVELLDATGIVRAALGTTKLKDKKTGSTVIQPPSSLILFDEKGDVMWLAP
jgi:hypothetical protein